MPTPTTGITTVFSDKVSDIRTKLWKLAERTVDAGGNW
jgi:hypothetical protein